MDWCVKPVKEANHPPQAGLFGFTDAQLDSPITYFPKPGEKFDLSAAGSSDPDGNALSYRWFAYREAGTYDRDTPIEGADKRDAKLTVPADAKGKSIHVVLEVTDDGTPKLTRYRRVVLAVR
jgi:hypothetical protein